jgi:hypothetical protein
MKLPTERAIQVAVFEYAKVLANREPLWNLLCAYPLQRGNDVLWLKLRMQEGAKKGWPDITWPIPRGGHNGLYLELKRKGNKPSLEQMKIITMLYNQGFCAECLIVDDWRQVIAFLQKYLDGKIIRE